MSDHDAMEEAIRMARRRLDVDDVIRAAEKNGGHITFGRGEPTLGEFVEWIQAHRGDVMGEEVTTHDAYVLWKDFLSGRDLPVVDASDVRRLNRRDGTIRAIESHLGALGRNLTGEQSGRVMDETRTIDVRVADALRYLTERRQ